MVECRLMLEQSARRPVGMLDNERYAAYSVWCERRILPVICVSDTISSLLPVCGVNVGSYLSSA